MKVFFLGCNIYFFHIIYKTDCMQNRHLNI